MNIEDQIMRLGYLKKINNDTSGYNAQVNANNVVVCYDDAHNNNKFMLGLADCDQIVTDMALALKGGHVERGLVPVMSEAVHGYLVIRGIINATGNITGQIGR